MDRKKLSPDHARIAEESSAYICACITRQAVTETVVITFPEPARESELETLDIAN